VNASAFLKHLIKMKTANKSEVKKKKEEKLIQKEKTSHRTNKDSKKTGRIDTDFHHEHPFKEQ